MKGRFAHQLQFVALVAALALSVPLAGADRAQQVPASQGTATVPVRVVNGHLIVLTDLIGLRYTNEASFEVSFEYPDALTLHPDQYRWLGLNPNELLGEPPLIHLLVAGGIRLSIPANEVAVETSEERLEFQNSMTKLHSKELGERKLKGTIGIGLLKRYLMTLDVSGRQLMLAPPREARPDAAAGGEPADLTMPFEYISNRIQVPMRLGDDRRAILVLGGTLYDTFIDSRVARQLGKPAGDLNPAWLADAGSSGRRIDLSQYLAFRPKAFGLSATPGLDSPLVITGVNFLESFRVELDWVNQRVALTSRKVPSYPWQDFAFFEAESRGTAEALEAYLTKYPNERLSADAAALLVRKRLEEDGSKDADVMKALQWAIKTTPANRRIETCLEFVETFAEAPGRTTLAIAAGEEGLKYSREAFDARVVYALHHRLGQLEMTRQNWDDAWKHLLSAAFMAPDDPLIMLDLARVYDKQGQVRRAYARYKRVAATPGAPPEIAAEIKSAMDRLRKQLPKDDPLLKDETPPATGRGGRAGGGGGGRS